MKASRKLITELPLAPKSPPAVSRNKFQFSLEGISWDVGGGGRGTVKSKLPMARCTKWLLVKQVALYPESIETIAKVIYVCMCGVARTKVGTLAASVQPRGPVSSSCKMRVCMMMGGRILYLYSLCP